MKVKVRALRAWREKDSTVCHKWGSETVLDFARAEELMKRGLVEILNEDKTDKLKGEIVAKDEEIAKLKGEIEKLKKKDAK